MEQTKKMIILSNTLPLYITQSFHNLSPRHNALNLRRRNLKEKEARMWRQEVFQSCDKHIFKIIENIFLKIGERRLQRTVRFGH
jgi:hypothetical protein